MSAPAGFTQLPSGEFMRNSDGAGPFVFDGTAMALAATGTGGGGGGGGAVTVADGADVAEGATADAVVAAGAAGTVSAKLRRISTDMGTLAAASPTYSTTTLQTAGNVLTGAVTEAAPASDTASSGLNGRLQRIAQRLTSLIAQLPATLGIKTAALSLSIAPASDATFATTSAVVTPADFSGTITAGGTAQNIIASNAARKRFEIQNQSTGDLWFSTLAAAVQSQPSIKIAAGQLYETPQGGAGTGAVSLIGATTAQAFAAREFV